MLFLPGSGGKKETGNGEAQAAVPSDSVSLEPSDDPSDLPLPTDGATTTPSKTVSASPSTSKSATPTPSTTRPRPPATQPRPVTPGRLAVSGCRMSSGDRSCTITVTASGGPVSWRVTGTSGNISASGGGTLAAGQSAGVRVTRGSCGLLQTGGSGSVSFSPNGGAGVSWSC
jgi:hypothetical protein